MNNNFKVTTLQIDDNLKIMTLQSEEKLLLASDGVYIAPRDLDPNVVEDYLNFAFEDDVQRIIKEDIDTYFAYHGHSGIRCLMLKNKFGMEKIQYDVFYA